MEEGAGAFVLKIVAIILVIFLIVVMILFTKDTLSKLFCEGGSCF